MDSSGKHRIQRMPRADAQMCKSPASQQGAVLVISLVLLVTMTVLGIATLTGTRLNEKITSNSQQKSIAFEVAESAIRAVWDVEYLRTRITSDPDNAGDNPIAVVSPEADSGVATGFDQTDGTGKGSDLSGLLTVQYCGEVAPIGSGLNEDQSTTQLASILVDVNSVANIANSSTTSDHLQRLGITTLRTQRTGNCQTR